MSSPQVFAIRAAAIWFAMLSIAVICGALRESFLTPRFGEQGAHVTGTLVVVALFVTLIAAMIQWIDPSLQTRRLILLGIAWTMATIAFEFSFGRLVAKRAWSELFGDYNVVNGKFWLLVPLTLVFGPSLLGWFRRAR